MVGGPIVNGQEDYGQYPFNLATEGTASQARRSSRSRSPWRSSPASRPRLDLDSAPQNFIVPNSGGKEHFIVHNFGNKYSGPITLARTRPTSRTTRCSRRSAIDVGTKTDRATGDRRMGIRTPVSTTPR